MTTAEKQQAIKMCEVFMTDMVKYLRFQLNELGNQINALPTTEPEKENKE